MIKITDKGKWPFAEMGDSGQAQGRRLVPDGRPPRRLQAGPAAGGPARPRAVRATAQWIQTDCTLVGGDSGGPLFDMQRQVIGIHSRISQSITGNIHVPVNTYRETWDRLAKGEEWGGAIGGSGRAGAGLPGRVVRQGDRRPEDRRGQPGRPGRRRPA